MHVELLEGLKVVFGYATGNCGFQEPRCAFWWVSKGVRYSGCEKTACACGCGSGCGSGCGCACACVCAIWCFNGWDSIQSFKCARSLSASEHHRYCSLKWHGFMCDVSYITGFLHEMANHSVIRYLLYLLLAKVFIGLHATRQFFCNQSKCGAMPAFITPVTNKTILQQKTHCSWV